MKRKMLSGIKVLAVVFVTILTLFFIVSSCHDTGRKSITKAPPVHELEMIEVPDDEEVMFDMVVEEEIAEPPTISHNTEEYGVIKENSFLKPITDPLSTFSIDVDKAAYANVRRFINNNTLPPHGAVRLEEMINYFDYSYPEPTGEHPFLIDTELSDCPWSPEHHLLKIALKGKSLKENEVKSSNLVFLLDVSGSMDQSDKLPLVKSSIKMMVENLDQNDRVSIVVYAGSAGLVLPSTSAKEKNEIYKAIDRLKAGGSTAGGEGIKLAYEIAEENLIPNGNNRVILATDGDFNVGVSSTDAMVKLIEEKREKGVYLSICGFGMGNYKDYRMEEISNAGNGNYFYIDSPLEAEKVFVKDLRSNLFTIAKDVKIQIEFNPAKVKSYRLIGYENRMLENSDFDNDKKDAGELGAGHTVTALYEIIPTNGEIENSSLKYQESKITPSEEWAHIKFRYKPIQSNQSILIEKSVDQQPVVFSKASENFQFASSVAAFGMLIRSSDYKGNITYEEVLEIAKNSSGEDPFHYRSEFQNLVNKARILSENQ